MSSKSKWAYLAGLIDSIGEFTLCGVMVPCDRPLAKWLIQHFGSVYAHKNMPFGGGLAWEKLHTEQFLLGVLPYLIVKRQDAQIALDNIRRLKSPETNTPDTPPGVKIESELRSDVESAPAVM